MPKNTAESSISDSYETIRYELSRFGFALVRGVISTDAIEAARTALTSTATGQGVRIRKGMTYAMRNLLNIVPALRSGVAETVRRNVIHDIMGNDAFVTRAILFDKPPHANWRVGWHQDNTIAVERKASLDGYGPWSVKAGVMHVRPPATILEGMVTARVALDDCDESNGALRVIGSSHLRGLLDSDSIRKFIESKPSTIVTCKAGDVLLMKPLLLHASHPARSPGQRRVVHLEFAAAPLPDPLRWHRA